MSWNRLKNRFIARMIGGFPSLEKYFVASFSPRESDDIPWTPVAKPLSESTIALVTTAGVHHRDQLPFDMIDRNGDPSYRVIDLTRPLDSLVITHDYYDHKDADQDVNVVLPVDRLREFAAKGIVREVAARSYGFMGHITGPHIVTLMNRTAREVARRLKQEGADIVLLTPG